jgi:hypothetical protein
MERSGHSEKRRVGEHLFDPTAGLHWLHGG